MSTPRDRIEAKLGLSGPPLQTLRDSPPQIPDHELVRRIGQGAYGEVWLARNALGTWRAVKIVYRDNFKDARPYEREFAGIRRFEPLSRSNEGFVDILQVGHDEVGGWFYYVMELADAARNQESEVRSQNDPGTTDSVPLLTPDSRLLSAETYQPRTLARDLHHRGRLPLEDCLQLGLTLTLALGHLHRHGLIHRDVKPSNIIFVGGVPKLADIGLVTEAQGANTFVGTEGFVPPEGPTSPQADLYALGKVLYEAAMGKDRNEFPEPFTQIGTDRESVALMELNAVLLRACAPEPRKRYATAEEMHADLALLHSGGSVKRRHQFDRQFQIVKRVGAVAIAATVLIGGALLWQRQQTQKMTRLANEKSALATEKIKLADNLIKLGEENRNRIVRLDIANGIRLLDEGDPAGALLWFADALPLLTNIPAQESIHRIRIQQTLNQLPRPCQVLAHDAAVQSVAFSLDGRRLATCTDTRWVHVWDTQTGLPLIKPFHVQGDKLQGLSFASNGERLLVTAVQDRKDTPDAIPARSLAIVEVASGKAVFSRLVTNLLQAEFIADGSWLATAGMDHVIRVVDVRDGHQVAALTGHTNNILGILTSIQGDVLVSFSKDRTLRVWRLPTGEPAGNPLPYNPELPLRPTLSKDGQRLATHRADLLADVTATNTVQIWRTDTMANLGGLMGRLDQVGTVWFVGSGQNRRLLSHFGGRIRVIEPDSQVDVLLGIQTGTLDVNVEELRDGSLLAVGGRNGLDGIWSLETGKLVVPPFHTAARTQACDVSDNGSHLALVADDRTCMIWRLESHLENATLRLPSNPRERIELARFRAFSPERSHLLLPLEDGSVRLIDLEHLSSRDLPGTASQEMEPGVMRFAHDHRQWAIHYRPKTPSRDTTLEIWRDDSGTLRRLAVALPQPLTSGLFADRKGLTPIWRAEDGVPSRFRVDKSKQVVALRFCPSDASVTTVSTDRQIQTWRTSDGGLESSNWAPETFECHEVFPDGRTILAWDRVRGFVLYDRVTGAIQPTLPGHDAITALVFDPPGERFATTTEDGWARVWSTKNGAFLSLPVQQGGMLTWADWSPDGSRIATAGFTPEVRVLNASSGEHALPPLRLGNDSLQTVMWSLDGRFLVARSDENVVRVWDAATGEAVTPLLKHESHIRLAHLVANNRLITVSLPNLLRAWDLTETSLPADVIMDYAKVVSGRRLTRAAITQPLEPTELAGLWLSVRARALVLFQ